MHDGQNWLRTQAQRKVPMVQVIRPEYDRQKHGDIQRHDYIDVPRESQVGTWTVLDMLSNPSIRNVIGVYNGLKTAAPKPASKLVPRGRARKQIA